MRKQEPLQEKILIAQVEEVEEEEEAKETEAEV